MREIAKGMPERESARWMYVDIYIHIYIIYIHIYIHTYTYVKIIFIYISFMTGATALKRWLRC